MPRDLTPALLRRVRHSFSWRISAVRHWLWSRLLLIPRLRARGELGRPTTVRYAHAGVVVLAPGRVLKGTLSRRGRVATEYARYRAALARWPALTPILAPLELREEAGAKYLLMERYQPITSDGALNHAAQLWQVMSACGRPAGPDLDLTRSPEVRAGIEVVAGQCGAAIVPLVEARLARLGRAGRCRVGFAHGDFHSRNIMLDGAGAPRLIDMDCVRVEAVQQVDALNFVLEAEWSRSGRQWFEQIAAYLCEQVPATARSELERLGVTICSDFALLYLLDRVGQETMNYGFHYLPAQLEPAAAILGRGAA